MTPRILRLLFLLAVVGLLAIAFVAPRFGRRYERQLQAQPAAVARWEQQIRQARQRRDDLLRRVETARQHPAGSAPADQTSPAPDFTQLTETERWVRGVKQLKQLFDRHPNEKIPELAVLDDQNWLSLARRAQLDTEDHRRRAFAIVRNSAKSKFVQFMQRALEAYVKANHGQLPTDTAELQPYLFDPTLDPAMLANYVMVRSGRLRDAPEGPVLRSKTLIDDRFDDFVRIERTPDASLTHTLARKSSPEDPGSTTPNRNDLNDQIEHDVAIAIRAFTAKNKGALPKSPAELIPYFDPPLGPGMTELFSRPLAPEQQRDFENDIAARAARRIGP